MQGSRVLSFLNAQNSPVPPTVPHHTWPANHSEFCAAAGMSHLRHLSGCCHGSKHPRPLLGATDGHHSHNLSSSGQAQMCSAPGGLFGFRFIFFVLKAPFLSGKQATGELEGSRISQRNIRRSGIPCLELFRNLLATRDALQLLPAC